MSKRKRELDAQASEAPVAKKQDTEPKQSAAERRQERSERKAKTKTGKPEKKSGKKEKEKELKRVKQDPSKHKQHNGHSPRINPEQLLPNANAGDDSFAGGEDFVSLGSPTTAKATATAITAASADPSGTFSTDLATTTEKKKKRQSPRSVRKAARTGKELADGETAAPASAPARFICFVGNLPYTTTTEQIQHHFRKIAPTAVRLGTDKNTGKPKGWAFIEFGDYSAMKTCLKVYHHSMFDPERTSTLPESAFDENGLEIGQDRLPEGNARHKTTGRRINVELTAGGGGKGAGRKDKIHGKNVKLFEERERRKKDEAKNGKKLRKEDKSEANRTEIGSEAVHPSRMQRVPTQQ